MSKQSSDELDGLGSIKNKQNVKGAPRSLGLERSNERFEGYSPEAVIEPLAGSSRAEGSKLDEAPVSFDGESERPDHADNTPNRICDWLVPVLLVVRPDWSTCAACPAVDEAQSDEGKSSRLARSLIAEARRAVTTMKTTEGLGASRRALALGDLMKNDRIRNEAATLQGHLLWAKGEFAESFRCLAEVAESARGRNDVAVRFIALWLQGFSSLLLLDPVGAKRFFTLAASVLAEDPCECSRTVCSSYLAFAAMYLGDLKTSRNLLGAAPNRLCNALLKLAQGDFERTKNALLEGLKWCGAQNLVLRDAFSFWLARLYRITWEGELALDTLQRTPLLDNTSQRIPEQVRARSELALILVQSGAIAEARVEVGRCKELMGSEDWRGLAGLVVRSNAVVLAAEGDREKADREFELAVDILFDYHLPWEHAETLTFWGWARLAAGEVRGEEQLRAAARIYKHFGAGYAWFSRVFDRRWQNRRGSIQQKCTVSSASGIQESALEFSSGSKVQEASGAFTEADGGFARAVDLGLLAAATHDAISHLMHAIDKASSLRRPIEHMAVALDHISKYVKRRDRKFRTFMREAKPARPNSNKPR